MSTYLIIHAEIENLADLKPYQELAAPSMKAHGIRLLGKTITPPVLEGAPLGKLTVLLEADDEATARAWYSSEGYREAIAARKGIADFTTVLVQSV